MFNKRRHPKIKKQAVIDQLAVDKATFLAKGGQIKKCEHGETKLTHRQLINPDQRKIN